MVHKLKIWPEFFEVVRLGDKRFEIRKDDRGFKDGDILILQEWDYTREVYTGRELECTVTFILRDLDFGVKEGFCVMSIILM